MWHKPQNMQKMNLLPFSCMCLVKGHTRTDFLLKVLFSCSLPLFHTRLQLSPQTFDFLYFLLLTVIILLALLPNGEVFPALLRISSALNQVRHHRLESWNVIFVSLCHHVGTIGSTRFQVWFSYFLRPWFVAVQLCNQTDGAIKEPSEPTKAVGQN